MKKADAPINESRRLLLKNGALVAAGTIATCALLRARPALADKADKSSMMFQDKPHGDQRCSGCIQFVPGASAGADGTCKVVAGSISPNAWCVAFTPKA